LALRSRPVYATKHKTITFSPTFSTLAQAMDFARHEPYAQTKQKSVVGSLDSLLKIVGISILENVWEQYFFTLQSYGITVIID